MTRSAASSLYDDDFFAWTQDQAAALRQLQPDHLGNQVDVAHVAEEIEDLGKRDLREVKSFLGRLFEYLIKLSNFPDSQAVLHWRSESRLFAHSASEAFSPSMRQSIDLAQRWRKSCRIVKVDMADAGLEVSVPEACPFSLEELLSDDFDIDSALTKVAAPTK